MAEVTNWQLGRKAQYPYEEGRPEKQFAIVFNINRCVGCQTCTMGCKSTWAYGEGQEYMWWNNVETKPYGGYPQFWDVKVLEMLGEQKWERGVYKGKTVFEAAPPGEVDIGYFPQDTEWRYPNIYEDTPAGDWQPSQELPAHSALMFYLQRTCNHCTYPACLAACPRKAIYKRKEDGIVLVDQSRCRGYRKCVRACPYKKTMYRPTTRTTEKCIGCYPRTEQGLLSRCVVTCVGKIRLQGWLNDPGRVDPENPIDYLVHIAKVALPLYPQFGLEPNLYYIPPRWVNPAYLTQLFGPGVKEAAAKVASPDETLTGAFRIFGMTPRLIEKFKVADRTASAYDGRGQRVVHLPFDEPFYERPAYDEALQVHRFNEP